MKQLKAKIRSGQAEINEDDPFEMFVSMTDIRYCFYKETHKILGNTFKMCVLQVSGTILSYVSLLLVDDILFGTFNSDAEYYFEYFHLYILLAKPNFQGTGCRVILV